MPCCFPFSDLGPTRAVRRLTRLAPGQDRQGRRPYCPRVALGLTPSPPSPSGGGQRWGEFGLAIAGLLLLASFSAAAAADWSLAGSVPARVDRVRGAAGCGEAIAFEARVTLATGSLELDSAAVGMTLAGKDVSAQYRVIRPGLPVALSTPGTYLLTFTLQPWSTATASQPVTVSVTLSALDGTTLLRETRTAACEWRVLDGADLLLGQSSYERCEQLETGLNGPEMVFADGVRLVVADTANHRVLLFEPKPLTQSGTRPRVVVGQPSATSNVPNCGGLGASTLWAPGAACVAGGRLFVCDTGNHRVLSWNVVPTQAGTPADVVLGQSSFTTGVENNGGVGPAGLREPHGVYSDGTRLFVADTGNHRVLVWNTIPTVSGTEADLVLGQPDFTQNAENNGASDGYATARSLCAPRAVHYDGSHLWIADTGNHRVLSWNSLPAANFAAASLVLGQPDLVANAYQAGTGFANANGFNWPTSVQFDGSRLLVADGDNNRVLVWSSLPQTNQATPSVVVGQGTFDSDDLFTPAPERVGQPRGCWSDGSRLYVADTGFHRVLVFAPIPSVPLSWAQAAVGQKTLDTGVANLGEVKASTFCVPEQLAVAGDRLAIADRQANRIHLFDAGTLRDGDSSAVVLGQPTAGSVDPNCYGLGASSLFEPTGVWLEGNQLLASDSANNRMLSWSPWPSSNKTPAEVVLGQPDFVSNGWGADAVLMNGPRGVAVAGGHLYVCDTYNNRILGWQSVPADNATPADFVLGQPDFAGFNANAGGIGAASLAGPRAVASDGQRLFVADSVNNRVLMWESLPVTTQVPADLVLGQSDFSGSEANALGDGAARLRSPFGLHCDGQRLFVADTDNHRVLVWDRLPAANATGADRVLGQLDSTGSVPNSGARDRFTLFEPRAVFSTGLQLYVSDTANDRVLRYDLIRLSRVRVASGSDRRADLGSTVVLSAQATSPASGSIVYSWHQESGPAAAGLLSPTAAAASFVASAGGEYVFSVVATDAGGTTGATSVHVLIDHPPTARAGLDLELNPAAQVGLNGSSSVDPDGDALTFSWRKLAGPAELTLTGADTATPSFVPTPNTTCEFELTVDDRHGGSSTDTVRVRVYRNPVARATLASSAGIGQRLLLDGSASDDPDGGTLTYAWSQPSGVAVTLVPSAAAASPTFVAPAQDTTLVFRLRVTNPRGAYHEAIVSTAIDGTPPTAALSFAPSAVVTARGPVAVDVVFSESMTTSGTSPAVTFAPSSGTGRIAGGPLSRKAGDTDSTAFSFPLTVSPTHNGVFEVVVSGRDLRGNELTAQPQNGTLTVSIVNGRPVARAVAASALLTGVAIRLDGSTSGDPDGDPITYLWSVEDSNQVPLPITRGTSSEASFVTSEPGICLARLIVTDILGAESDVRVLPLDVKRGNRPPEVSLNVTERAGAIGLEASFTATPNDPDNDPLTYRWTLDRVPPGCNLTPGEVPAGQGGRSVTVRLTPNVPGIYLLTLTVDDQHGHTATASATLTVDDHADQEPVDAADVLTVGPGQSATRDGIVERAGDKDLFELVAVPGRAYDVGLSVPSTSTATFEVELLEGGTVRFSATATPGTTARLETYRPPTSQRGRFLRVRARDNVSRGAYILRVAVRDDPLRRPPRLTLAMQRQADQLQGVVSSGGTTHPLAFLKFLAEYDETRLKLVGYTPLAGALVTQPYQFRQPFVNFVLSPRSAEALPMPTGPLVRLEFEPASAQMDVPGGLGLHAVTAVPAQGAGPEVTVFGPAADAGISLSIRPVAGSGGALYPNTRLPGGPPSPHVWLDGRLSSDPNARLTTGPDVHLTYRWRCLSPLPGPVLSDEASPTPTFTPQPGTGYQFGLVVSNGVLDSATATVQLQLGERPDRPFAVALVRDTKNGLQAPGDGPPLVVTTDTRVELDASPSSFGESAGQRSYRWTLVEGPATVTLPATGVVSFVPAAAGLYRFELTVRDQAGRTSLPLAVKLVARPLGDVLPGLSIQAEADGNGTVARDLGPDPDRSNTTALVVAPGQQVTLVATATDPDVAGSQQELDFTWTRVSGPVVNPVQLDEPFRSTLRFNSTGPGELLWTCVVREKDRSGRLVGPRVERSIRVLVTTDSGGFVSCRGGVEPDNPTRKQGPVTASQPPVSLIVTGGTAVCLRAEASVSTSELRTHPLAYRWTQVRGTPVVLSDATSPVATFVVPNPAGGLTEQLMFHLYASDAETGQLRSTPYSISMTSVAQVEQEVRLPLVPGLNLVSVPLEVQTTRGPMTVADLAQQTSATFVAYPREGQGGGAQSWAVHLADASSTGPTVAATRAYLLMLPRAAPSGLTLRGLPCSTVSRWFVPGGSGPQAVGLPAPLELSTTESDLLVSLGGSILITTRPDILGVGRFRALTPEMKAGEARRLGRGRGYLVVTRLRQPVDLGSLVR